MTVTRGTTNGNARGSSYSRAARRAWLLRTYAADTRATVWYLADGTHRVRPVGETVASGWGPTLIVGVLSDVPACRCYRCGTLLVDGTLTVDRIIPGRDGGTYRRDNIRPACGPCNERTGGALRRTPTTKKRK